MRAIPGELGHLRPNIYRSKRGVVNTYVISRSICYLVNDRDSNIFFRTKRTVSIKCRNIQIECKRVIENAEINAPCSHSLHKVLVQAAVFFRISNQSIRGIVHYHRIQIRFQLHKIAIMQLRLDRSKVDYHSVCRTGIVYALATVRHFARLVLPTEQRIGDSISNDIFLLPKNRENIGSLFAQNVGQQARRHRRIIEYAVHYLFNGIPPLPIGYFLFDRTIAYQVQSTRRQ